MPRPVILLDANVLIPFDPRDTLLKAAEHNLCRVVCSEMILAEVRRNFPQVRNAGDATEKAQQADALVSALRIYFRAEYAMIEDFERHIPRMLNDPKDRHVTAAAWKAGKGTIIVTFNTRDFRADHLAPTTSRHSISPQCGPTSSLCASSAPTRTSAPPSCASRRASDADRR